MLDYKRVNDDIVLNGDLQIVTDYLDNVVQKIILNLKRFRGEDFLDITKGIDYFGLVLVQSPDQILIESLFKKSIYEIEEVEEITTFNLDFNRVDRILTIGFSARLKNNEIANVNNLEIEV